MFFNKKSSAGYKILTPYSSLFPYRMSLHISKTVGLWYNTADNPMEENTMKTVMLLLAEKIPSIPLSGMTNIYYTKWTMFTFSAAQTEPCIAAGQQISSSVWPRITKEREQNIHALVDPLHWYILKSSLRSTMLWAGNGISNGWAARKSSGLSKKREQFSEGDASSRLIFRSQRGKNRETWRTGISHMGSRSFIV